MARTTRKAPVGRPDLITTAIYERAREAGCPLRGLYPSTLRRVRELCEEVGDDDQVEVVALAALELDGVGFVAHRTLSWGTFEYVRDSLRVPDGGWGYALLVLRLPEGRARDSVDYWLRRWRDADGVDEVEADRARRQLAKLRDAVEDEEAVAAL